MGLLVEATNVIAGLVLLGGALRAVPLVGKDLVKLSKWLGSFQTLIGVIAIIVGIVCFGLQGLVAIIAGLVLAAGILPAIPAVGKSLEKLSKWLGGFQTFIGVIALLLGPLGIAGVI
jgi:cadmium resistance protein CadD (predicted permease)